MKILTFIGRVLMFPIIVVLFLCLLISNLIAALRFTIKPRQPSSKISTYEEFAKQYKREIRSKR